MRFAIYIMVFFIGTLAMWAPQSSAKEEIYRWVDDKGVVHFGDRAPEQKDAEVVSIQQTQSSNAQPVVNDASVEGQNTQAPQPSVAQQMRDQRAEARSEREAKAKVTAKSCEQARKLVSQLEPSPRVNVTHEDGTVTRMDDNDRLEKLGEAQAFIAAECDN